MIVDEASFHINSCDNDYNCWLWGSQQPNEYFEDVRGIQTWTCGVDYCMAAW
jgi:hypothetical protein